MRAAILIPIFLVASGILAEANTEVNSDEVVIWDGSNYFTVILWDESPLTWFKAVDYYIIPDKSENNFAFCEEGQLMVAHFKVRIIERTTWLGFLSNDKVIFDEDLPRDGLVYKDFKFGRKLSGRPVMQPGEVCAKYDRAYLVVNYPSDYTLKKEVELTELKGNGFYWR